MRLCKCNAVYTITESDTRLGGQKPVNPNSHRPPPPGGSGKSSDKKYRKLCKSQGFKFVKCHDCGLERIVTKKAKGTP